MSWHNHTQYTNPAGNIVGQLKRRIRPELCTQAWAKFFEILSNFNILTEVPSHTNLRSVHLCEAPGAFITGLNHFLTIHHSVQKRKWQWISTTLNPYYEGNSLGAMISDDRFILHTLDHWVFGKDNTGDVMKVSNLEYLRNTAESMGMVQLVTADGSIDCSSNPSEQEIAVSWLHYCEVVTALHLLAHAGNLVIKMFTFFESSAASLLFLLNCSFNRVTVFKPSTSKAGNSEVYVVCQNYNKEMMDLYQEVLKGAVEKAPGEKALLERHQVSDSFMVQLRECCTYYKNHQVRIIKQNILWYDHISCKNRHYIEDLKKACVNYYMEEFNVKRIHEHECIIPRKHPKSSSVSSRNLNYHLQHGSFNEWQEKSKLPLQNKLEYVEQLLHKSMPNGWKLGEQPERTFVNGDIRNRAWMNTGIIVRGKSFQVLRSSRFCNQHLLNLWFDVQQENRLGHEDTNSRWSENALHCSLMECMPKSPGQSSLADVSCFMSLNCLRTISDTVNVIDLQNEVGHLENTFALSKLLWIRILLYAIKNLKSGDHLILVADDIQSRFTVGCVFTLIQYFAEATLMRPLSVPPKDPRVLLRCVSFCPPEESITQYLEEISTVLTTITSDTDVLEIFPVLQLVECDSYQWLHDFNEAKTAHQISTLIRHLRNQVTSEQCTS